MYKTILCVLWFAIKTVIVLTQSCEYVYDFRLFYKDTETKNTEWNNIAVTGCISDNSFHPKRVTYIFSNCVHNGIPTLEKDFINNMADLRIIKIHKCHVESLEPGAFSNLPKLEMIDFYDNGLKTISSGVFNILPSLQKIYLVKNRISFVEDNAFSNLPNLQVMQIDRGELEEMKREWFTNTSNIEIFSVYHNNIHRVPYGMFHGWTKLKSINLNSNAISVIENPFFNNNSKLITRLDLHHNRLTTLSPDMLPDSTFFQHFSVSANLLNFIPEEFLRKIRAANFIIFGNPFSCACLDKINKILLENDVTVDSRHFDYVKNCKDGDVPVCGCSSNCTKTCVDAVDKELTKKIISQMKSVGYDAIHDSFGQQCAMFDV